MLPCSVLYLMLVGVSARAVWKHSYSSIGHSRRSIAHRALIPNDPLQSVLNVTVSSDLNLSGPTTLPSTSDASSGNRTAPTALSQTATASNAATTAAGGIINATTSCGPSGATRKINETNGPNGSVDWLNCGVAAGGWRPPFLRIEDIITVDLIEAADVTTSPFKACAAYLPLFQKYGEMFEIPPIILASFAMQESTCNPETVGDGGEQGLMQITKDKCNDAPNGNCRDPEYNIQTGAQYFATSLRNNDGDLLLTIGGYNGWSLGMTIGQATAAAHSSCCRCQNNLDYLHQFLNGWCQNVDAYARRLRLGKYFNLAHCG